MSKEILEENLKLNNFLDAFSVQKHTFHGQNLFSDDLSFVANLNYGLFCSQETQEKL